MVAAKNHNHNGAPEYFTSVKKAFSHKHPERVLTMAPSILSANFASLAQELRKMARAKCYWTHLDIMDGHFVPNITFGPPAVESIRKVSSRLFLDAHLMIEDPMKYYERFAEAGADLINIHAEVVEDLPKALKKIKKAGVRVGVTLKPKTPVKAVKPVLDIVDMVLVMTVEPGFGGQSMMPNTLSKVRHLARRRARKGYNFLIQVDGGINEKTAGLAVAAGANVLVAGSAIFGSGNIAQNISNLTDAALKMGV
ncbi:MAG: ribulose-phosphate 3-epimerase [bacterium]